MWKRFVEGIWKENPVLVLLLGLCPTLAVTTNIKNALGMAAASTFVLIGSNLVISIFGRFFPPQIRIPCFIVVIASFVSTVELLMQAYLPALNKALGIFIPLIVVNCMILGRAEAFASKNRTLPSVLDGLGMGLGFGLALFLLAFFRELLGAGTLWKIPVTGYFSSGEEALMKPLGSLVLAPGAFLVLGLILACKQAVKQRREG